MKRKENGCIKWVLILVGVSLLIQYWYIVLLVGVGVGFWIYKKKQQQRVLQAEREHFEKLLEQATNHYKKFILFQEEDDEESMEKIGEMLLGQLDSIASSLARIEELLGFESYQSAYRLVKSKEQIAGVLESLRQEAGQETGEAFARMVQQTAPEIYELYLAIHEKNTKIDSLIQQMDNNQVEELTAEHGVVVDQFSDILSGYLKIKQNPEHYHEAEERLIKARRALELLEEQLTFSLRQLNEENLAEFEISLRMIQQEKE